ncbi:hypothetical protein N8146_06530 [Ascidiaceihabitans sp.]|nr:hypothetical protein [Ascidiaceihabitans sp.]
MFGLLFNKINVPNLSTQCFWELTTPNVVNILLCCAQISVGLIGNANTNLRIVTKLGAHRALSPLRQYPHSWSAKTNRLAAFQKRTIHPQNAQKLLPLIAMQIVHTGNADLSVVPTLKSIISLSTPTKTDEQSTV